MAVFGTPGFDDPDAMSSSLARCEALRDWASQRGVALADDAESLSALEDNLDAWSAEPRMCHGLGNEVGLYLGTVIVKHVPGARWHA